MKGRSEMKRIILFLPLFLLICCINKNQELSTGNDKKNKKSTAERKEEEKRYMSNPNENNEDCDANQMDAKALQ